MATKLIYKTKVDYGEFSTKYSLRLYKGCGHGCRYCYVRRMFRKKYSDWIKAEPYLPKNEYMKQLEKDVEKINPNDGVLISFTTDCYQPIEMKLRYMPEILKLFNEYDVRTVILTKSSNVLRDLDLLSRMSNVAVGITITTTDITEKRRWEPHSPGPRVRIATVKQLYNHNIPVWISVEPILDDTWPYIVLRTKDYAQYYIFGKLNYFRTYTTAEWIVIGHEIKRLCKDYGLKYYIKPPLSELMKSAIVY